MSSPRASILPSVSPASTAAPVPPLFLATLAVAACFMAFVAWDQSYWWTVKEDYSFGWLVPLFVAYVVWERRPAILALLRGETPPNANAPLPAWLARVLGSAAWFGLVGGLGLFLVGAGFRAGGGPSYTGTIALALGTAALTLSLLYLLAPPSPPAARAERPDPARRLRLAALFLFPALVWLLSAPMLTGLENTLNLFLRRQVTHVVFTVFDLLGFPLEQRGNLLVLPTGTVGVEEACSGIRSLTGCLFAGTFLAAVYLPSLWRKIALVSLALVLAFVTNLLRGLFLTAWSYRYGPQAIEGTIHDTSGYAVLGLTVVALLALLPLITPRRPVHT